MKLKLVSCGGTATGVILATFEPIKNQAADPTAANQHDPGLHY